VLLQDQAQEGWAEAQAVYVGLSARLKARFKED
jgi:hypothetical protein